MTRVRVSKTEKTYLEEAGSSRKWAKGLRVYGVMLYVLAAAFAIPVVLMFASGDVAQGALTSVSVSLIAFWGWFARNHQAGMFEDSARRWENLDSRYGYLPR